MQIKIKQIVILCMIGINILSAQNITVKTQTKIQLNAKVFYPTLNAEGDKLLYSNESYKGLYLYDFSTKNTKEISQEQNSGYFPVFSVDNSKIFFRTTNFENRLRYDALQSYDIKSSKKQQMLSPQRNLRQAQGYHNGVLVLSGKTLVKSTFGVTKKTIPAYVSSEDLNIYVYNDGERKQLKPFSENVNYIWVSISPDNKRILFTATGKGTYICDLNGKITSSLGYLNAPVWYDNDFVVGMQDKDNGQFVTSSTVIMVSVDGKTKKQISSPKHVAMYPACSAKSGRIVYNTLEGELFLSEIVIK